VLAHPIIDKFTIMKKNEYRFLAVANFTNILLADFEMISFRRKITYPNCRSTKALVKHLQMKKNARKMFDSDTWLPTLDCKIGQNPNF